MRITCVSVSDQMGGSEAALLEMIASLGHVRPDWKFQIVLPGDGPLGDRLREVGAACSIVRMPAPLARLGEWGAVSDGWSASAQMALGLRLCESAAVLPGYESRLRRTISAFQPNLIHTNGFKAHVLGARLKERQHALVWHLHEYVSPRRVSRWLLRRYMTRCDAAIANSASVAADATSSLSMMVPLHVVANGIDLTTFAPGGCRLDLDSIAGLAPAPADVIRIGLVATFGRWKGHDLFLDAVQRAASRRPIRGYIIGGPVYDTLNSQYTPRELQAMIDARQLHGRVGLAGFVDAASAMRALDIVVHASTGAEPFGLVIAEAMACGRPVITTGHGGAAELVEPGQDAIVVPPGDAPRLAEAMERLADDPALREAIGERARESAVRRFAPGRMAADVARVFESVGRRPAFAQSA
jgi:glycosyltransferase involved in cell wall biosynthesis